MTKDDLGRVSKMTVSQMLDRYEEAVRANLRARLDATSHGGRYFDKAHTTTVDLDELRDAIEAELLERIESRVSHAK